MYLLKEPSLQNLASILPDNSISVLVLKVAAATTVITEYYKHVRNSDFECIHLLCSKKLRPQKKTKKK